MPGALRWLRTYADGADGAPAPFPFPHTTIPPHNIECEWREGADYAVASRARGMGAAAPMQGAFCLFGRAELPRHRRD